MTHRERKEYKEGDLFPDDIMTLEKQAILSSDEKQKVQGTLNEMRKKYADKPLALAKIDMYDDQSPYGKKRQEHLEAMRANDQEKVAELDEWFKLNYPLLEREKK